MSGGRLLETFSFLVEHGWMSDFQLTKFLLHRVWLQIPVEWEETLLQMTLDELNRLPYGHMKENWPRSFRAFISRSLNLSLDRDEVGPHPDFPLLLESQITRGMTPKKFHEVARMSGFVHKLARTVKCDTIVDIGSGLGYLDVILCHQLGYNVIGIECKDSLAHQADSRAFKYVPETKINRKLSTCRFEMEDSCRSLEDFQRLLHNCAAAEDHIDFDDDLTPTSWGAASSLNVTGRRDDSDRTRTEASTHSMAGKFCSCVDVNPDQSSAAVAALPSMVMVGLHCCGDLTPTMLSYCTQLNCVKAIACVSCCYHKMECQAGGTFVNFPMSKEGKRELQTVQVSHPDWKVNMFCLRLAAQETRARWLHRSAEERESHMKNVAYRGLLEILLQAEGIQQDKGIRQAVRKPDLQSPDSYIRSVLKKLDVDAPDPETFKENLRNAFMDLHEEYNHYFRYIEPIMALQVVLQPVIESLVYLDRAAFLKESGFQAEVMGLFDESVSPRNLVLVAQRCSETV